MTSRRKKYVSVILPAGLLIILFYLVLKLYQDYDRSTETSGNPILSGWYADPEIVLFDSTFWIFPTYSAPFSDQVFMDAFSSSDLVNWNKYKRIIDTSLIQWADSAMWAPSAIERDGKYYLFFAANDLQTADSRWYRSEVHKRMTGGIGIAVADNPSGPYQDYLGRPLIDTVINGAQPIDQFVFFENNNYYIVYGGWGNCNLGILNDEFTGLEPFPDGSMVKEITPPGYVEGPVIFKHVGQYYMMWSEGNWTDTTYRVAYGISESVEGPYIKQGVVLKRDTAIATGAGHHSVLNLPGTNDWYIVYHRRPIPNDSRDHRVTCIDRLYFDKDGSILPVKMTNTGVTLQPF